MLLATPSSENHRNDATVAVLAEFDRHDIGNPSAQRRFLNAGKACPELRCGQHIAIMVYSYDTSVCDARSRRTGSEPNNSRAGAMRIGEKECGSNARGDFDWRHERDARLFRQKSSLEENAD